MAPLSRGKFVTAVESPQHPGTSPPRYPPLQLPNSEANLHTLQFSGTIHRPFVAFVTHLGSRHIDVNSGYWMNQVHIPTDASEIIIALTEGTSFGFLIAIGSLLLGP